MTGGLTTHVLDIARGQPAAGMRLELWRVSSTSGERELLCAAQTNADGRLDAPLLTGDTMKAGTYELVFEVGTYFSDQGGIATDPPFLDGVPVRFSIGQADQHYHVPLLVSPWAYSTYRGS